MTTVGAVTYAGNTWGEVGDIDMDDDTLTGVGLDYDDESAITPEGPLPGLSLPIPARVAAIVAVAFIALVIARRSFKGAFNS